MTNEECFAIWAPDGAAWSQWAKPTMFAQLALPPGSAPGELRTDADVSWAPTPRRDTAIVVDLPGAESVQVGIALARLGYRPVPLFNATDGPSALVDVAPVARSLVAGAEALRRLTIRPDAPPAFLLDADRMRARFAPNPGSFDNRSIVFPQDFPSATLLQARGIREVLLVEKGELLPGEDLAHVLLRWQKAGIRLLSVDVQRNERPRDLRVRPPSLFRRAWYRAVAIMGLRRSNVGGFGAVIPMPAEGGGHG